MSPTGAPSQAPPNDPSFPLSSKRASTRLLHPQRHPWQHLRGVDGCPIDVQEVELNEQCPVGGDGGWRGVGDGERMGERG